MMPHEERSAWIMLVLAIVAYSVYGAIVLGQAGEHPLTEVDYVPPLLWTIAGSIVASMVLHALFGVYVGKESSRKDERDREIARLGDVVGNSFVVIGALGALVLALFELGYFWIANLVYLCFVLSAVLGSITRIVAYRRGFQTW